jgi:hypothetical protein
MTQKITLGGQELFPTRYFSGDDLAGKSYTVEIVGIKQETMTNPKTHAEQVKPVIYFAKTARGAVLGKEFAESIADALKEWNANAWTGKKIIIHPQQTRLGTGIRARAVETNHAEATPPKVDEDEEE